MLKIHQPYKSKYIFAFVGIGVLLLGSLVIINSSEKSVVYAAGDSRTIHDISDMQEMTQQICSNTDEGDTATLTDNRDGKTYAIIKHSKDKNCWMQQNLRLGSTSEILLKPGDTNITSDYILPAGTSSGSWVIDSTKDQAKGGQVRLGNTRWNNSWQTSWGNYYSWCAATAGTCSESTADNVNVSGSICPKGWHLPSGGSANNIGINTGQNSEFYKLFGADGANLGDNYQVKFNTLTASPYLFSTAGGVYNSNGSLSDAGSNGVYWSHTSISSRFAYYLFFNSGDFYPGTTGNFRYIGFPIRCVALGGLEKIEKPVWVENMDGNVTVTMPSVISIDAASGMDKTADAAKVIEGTATATISSNTEYNISIHSTQPSLKYPKVTTAEISPVSSTNPVEPGNNAWGLWDGSGDINNKSYTLPITNTPQDLYNSKETVTNAEGNLATKHTYYVGISISPALPSGVYATDVIITASTK